MVEYQPYKLNVRVRFPSPAPKGKIVYAHVAQLVEHILGKDEVTGSIPVVGSRGYKTVDKRRLLWRRRNLYGPSHT